MRRSRRQPHRRRGRRSAIAEQVATAATELSASASSLSDSTTAAVDVADTAKETGRSLASSSAEIEQVGSVQSAARQSTSVMDDVGGRIRAMDNMVDGISIAVHGDASIDAYGLSQMAEMLRTEVGQFMSVMRAS